MGLMTSEARSREVSRILPWPPEQSVSGHSLSGYSFLESSCYAVTSPQHVEIPLTDTLVNSSAELSTHSQHELPPQEESPWTSFLTVQSLSPVWLSVTPGTAVRLASLSFTISRSFLKFTSIESVMPSNHPILFCPLLLLPSIFPSIRVFSSKLALHIRWPKYWSFSFGIGPSNEYSGLISFRIDQFDLLAIQGPLKSHLFPVVPLDGYDSGWHLTVTEWEIPWDKSQTNPLGIWDLKHYKQDKEAVLQCWILGSFITQQ